MNYITAAALAIGLATPVFAQKAEHIAEARAAAESWLVLIDTGEYAASWNQAAPLFQQAVTQSEWAAAAEAARSPLGTVQSRTLASATYTRTLPGAPDGEYVVIHYQSQFEHKTSASETITPLKEADGTWKIAGYFID